MAESMLEKELAGKHNAAQVYDQRIWKIRTGFLTLSFASWGALIAVDENLGALQKAAVPLLIISVALATRFSLSAEKPTFTKLPDAASRMSLVLVRSMLSSALDFLIFCSAAVTGRWRFDVRAINGA